MKTNLEILFIISVLILTTGYGFAMTDPFIFQQMIQDLTSK